MSLSCLEMTSDEVVAYLNRSFLPTVLVEGVGDLGVLRKLEHELLSTGVDFMPLGGKSRLHQVYLRRHEVGSKSIVFLRDRDEYVAEQVPEELMGYVLTSGYSIENDILSKDAMSLIGGDHWPRFGVLIGLVAEWFRCALQIYIDSEKTTELARDISWIINDEMHSADAVAEIVSVDLKQPFSELDIDEAWVWLRGKTLLRSIHYFFQGAETSYSKVQLLDLSMKLGPSPAFSDLVARLQNALRP
jgi:hypothetical protein